MRWTSCFFGKEELGFTLSRTTTQNFIIRAMAYRGSLGTWFDEYRNKESQDKSELFRSIFNRQVSGKGTNSSIKVKGFAVNSTLAISGEETPNDNALFTRCVHLQFSSYKRNADYYEWMQKHCEDFSAFTMDLILNYDKHKDKILEYIKQFKKALTNKGITDRTAENWSICAGAYSAVVGMNTEYIEWVEENCQEIKKTGEQEHMLNQFWEDVFVLYMDKELDKKYLFVEDNHLFIWFVGAYDKWAIHYKKKTGKEAFERNTILKYLTDEPYYVDTKKKRMDGPPKWVYVIDIAKATDTVQELAEAVREAQDINARALGSSGQAY